MAKSTRSSMLPSSSIDEEGTPLDTTPDVMPRLLTPPLPPQATDADSIALQACDDVDSLREVWRAYVCLEKLLVPLELADTEQVYPTRTELSSLVRLINDEMHRRIELIDTTLHAARAPSRHPV